MGKVDTVKKLLKVSLRNPKSYLKIIPYAVKYGLVGLRARMHEELTIEDYDFTKQDIVPGSVDGSMLISVIMPTFNVSTTWINKAIDSVERQSYSNWELCIVDDASENEDLRQLLLSKRSEKIKVKLLDVNEGISSASNAAIDMSSGEYCVLLDNDDELLPTALEEVFLCVSATHADIVYSDHEIIDENNKRLAVLRKPDWSYDLLLSQMYIGHMLSFKKALFDKVGGFDSRYDGSQDYDLLLRMIEHTQRIEHIQEVLYSWRSLASSTAGNPYSKPYAQDAGRMAVQSHLDRVLGKGETEVFETENLFVYDVRYTRPQNVTASLIILTKDHVDDLRCLLESIQNRHTDVLYEILIVDNNSVEKETAEFYKEIKDSPNIEIIEAKYDFNWSKLNNEGVKKAKGDVLVFLNNDMEIKTDYWLDRLVENALRPSIGVVGALLLYPDNSIQHAGVVVGMNGWADHVYKGAGAVHNGNPFISPMVTRNVSAVTGACMAISRKTLDSVGLFDENFIVCGSDVEMCLRMRKHDLQNIYIPSVQIMHYESKSRDPKRIPKIDFKLSDEMYREYRATGDPFYNPNLDIDACIPREITQRERIEKKIGKRLNVSIPEIRPIHMKWNNGGTGRPCINLCIPSINTEDTYGGISSALKLFNELVEKLDARSRIIVFDNPPRKGEALITFPEYDVVDLGEQTSAEHSIVNAVNRSSRALEVNKNDWFLATSWWTAHCLNEATLSLERAECNAALNPMLYLIQDYEPGFYPWSSRFLLADATYRCNKNIIAIFNSNELKEFFSSKGYTFYQEFVFEPFLNPELKLHLERHNGITAKKKQILIYGRPNTDRNAFELIVEGLRKWREQYPESSQWEVVSAGEDHCPVALGKGKYIASVGKLSLASYAELLSESYAGISLMVSPHPSYPPLEMAAFGVEVITNAYYPKDLSGFSKSIHSLSVVTPMSISECLIDLCKQYVNEKECNLVDLSYVGEADPFPFIEDLIAELLKGVK